MRVIVCGARGSTPAPGIEFSSVGGHTSCVTVAHDGDTAPRRILDAGTGIRRVSALLGDDAFAGTILLGHLHWDHTQGLPDAQYTDEELPQRGSFGHSSSGYAVGLAEASGAKRLLLYHHDPAHTDREVEAIVASHSAALVPVADACEGMALEIGRPATT